MAYADWADSKDFPFWKGSGTDLAQLNERVENAYCAKITEKREEVSTINYQINGCKKSFHFLKERQTFWGAAFQSPYRRANHREYRSKCAAQGGRPDPWWDPRLSVRAWSASCPFPSDPLHDRINIIIIIISFHCQIGLADKKGQSILIYGCRDWDAVSSLHLPEIAMCDNSSTRNVNK